jgi:hypothetical protein
MTRLNFETSYMSIFEHYMSLDRIGRCGPETQSALHRLDRYELAWDRAKAYVSCLQIC